MSHFVFRFEGGGYVGTRKNNGSMYKSRVTVTDDLIDARIFNTKAAASNAGNRIKAAGEPLEVMLVLQ